MSTGALHKLKVFYDWMYKVVMFICKILLIADICVVSLTVLGRYVPFHSRSDLDGGNHADAHVLSRSALRGFGDPQGRTYQDDQL